LGGVLLRGNRDARAGSSGYTYIRGGAGHPPR